MDESISLKDYGKMVKGIEDVHQCWGIILNTIKGSDPLRPEFGSSLYDYIDKPVSVVKTDWVPEAVADLERWESRTTVEKVQVMVSGSTLVVMITGTYLPTKSPVVAGIPLFDVEIHDSVMKRSYSEAYNQQQYK